MRRIQTFTVVPTLPDKLRFLEELAHNMWWCWNHDAVELFRRIDRELWRQYDHNPVRLLGTVSQQRLERLAGDDGFLAHLARVEATFRDYMGRGHWFGRTQRERLEGADCRVAYFSLEYGLSESVPIYSGGLGVLAGDHLKSSSDLGVPLVGVGLLYHQGYFRQYLNADGWQQEHYPENDFYNMALRPARDADGKQVVVDVDLADRKLYARAWRVQVGRVPLILLDANIPDNAPHDREVTAALYGGNRDTRIRQEILLGIGGLRALRALGLHPTVCHMNEGHSAFLALELIREARRDHDLSFQEAAELVGSAKVFTTHTPVPAGNERFAPELVVRYLAGLIRELGLSEHEFLALGRENQSDSHEAFCMTVLALRLADHSNGVSKLHGAVSRNMWARVWPEVPEDEIPISSITNGIHTQTWISSDMARLFDTYLGPRWARDPAAQDVWKRVHSIPDAELWRTHSSRREQLVAFARRRLHQQLRRRGLPEREAAVADEVLDPAALTLGFARRFATYKRAALILRNMDRLRRILTDPERPVQLIFAGKAHPMDNDGKELIRKIVHTARDPELRRRIVFIEDYDMRVARAMVQGVDVWLNTPLRPKEASGTSGMKAAANGALNMSIPDGWWAEGYGPDHGWSIGRGEEYTDLAHQEAVESNALYDLLEREVVPAFYDRSKHGLPRKWIQRIKRTIDACAPVFTTHRMVREYTESCYMPAARRARKLRAEGMLRGKTLAAWKHRVAEAWPGLRVASVVPQSRTELPVGAALEVAAEVDLNGLSPNDLRVELYHGSIDSWGNIPSGQRVRMTFDTTADSGQARFVGSIPCDRTGRHGYTVRILPDNEDLSHPYELFCIRWA